MKLPIDSLRTDGGTQPRAFISFATVDAYQDEMEAGAKFPPINVYFDGENYWLADGFHRVRAAQQAGRDVIDATIHQGTRDDAQWHSFAANKAHGLQRTPDDKKRAVEGALRHQKAEAMSDHQIAKHVGCSRQWVSEVRSKSGVSSKPLLDSPAVRVVTRGGKTFEMNVGAIGKSSPGGRERGTDATTTASGTLQKLSNRAVWNAQETKHFRSEILRLVRSYQKTHPPVSAITITQNDGKPVDIKVTFAAEVAGA
ncbi:MAG: ParB N-terminal domain-containing protein [Bryobacterales bacterium]|nr:ParB N-terminal domain-containing protein [Bryobacterales bacterium]